MGQVNESLKPVGKTSPTEPEHGMNGFDCIASTNVLTSNKRVLYRYIGIKDVTHNMALNSLFIPTRS